MQGHWNFYVVLCFLNTCSNFQFVLIHLIIARIRKYNQTFKSNPIICLCIHSVYNTITWQEIRLSTSLANSWYSSSKAKRKCHASNAQFKFKQRSSFNREIKLTWFFKSVDRQNRSMMPLSYWHFDDGCALWRGYEWPCGKLKWSVLDFLPFCFGRLSLKMSKFSLVVCKIVVAILLKTFIVGFLEKWVTS